ncbi:cytochrome P450 [Shewanella sp. 1_MG-2023]|uniref:cytochrome P450 n=1 Tax=unclassified Shewanella TaxID=196818 RepID=UPI0026E216A8|nr:MULTISPECIES: cytochrome P450 [unclassified Shewanella]MDO6612310.1 cytochrome P450 [Shewanella sp. 7_MG-2023]MDO6772164.1 cytochrome P450 [Shewanella sp. 2_MG-2023]MDO6794070.1 cytochrome P450 [Shewanella sp. 1_MG-2023]
MKVSELPDPFEQTRLNEGAAIIDDQDDPVTMVLGLKDVRKCAHNWKVFQSGGEEVGRIVVPSEMAIRDTRQIPFEVDPPKHKGYRDLVEPWFKRPLELAYQEKLSDIINDLVDEVIARPTVEVVTDFALKLQSRALTLLLNIPYEESELWISWGTHVFRSDDTALDASKANILYDYIDTQIDKAAKNPGDDLYSLLLKSEANGKKLTREEVKGVMILTFAGGRDTIINAVTNTVAYLADHPESLVRLDIEPDITGKAVEELVRYFSPLTHMGRIATEDTQVCEHAIKAQSRISLCWASANRDSKAFENANEVVLDRKINPHVGFGFSTHNCLGATHARQLLALLLKSLASKVNSITVNSAEDNIEDWDKFQRKIGFHALNVTFKAK